MIEPTYVTYEQAILLKEKGFDCEYCLIKVEGEDNFYTQSDYDDFPDQKDKELQYPEQWQVVEWLRREKGIWIHSAPENNEEDVVKWAFTIQQIDTEVRFVRRVGEFNLPQEAYSAAFDYILNNLI